MYDEVRKSINSPRRVYGELFSLYSLQSLAGPPRLIHFKKSIDVFL